MGTRVEEDTELGYNVVEREEFMTTKAAERAAIEWFKPHIAREARNKLANLIDREAKLPELLAVAKAADDYAIAFQGSSLPKKLNARARLFESLAALGDLEEL